MKIKGNAFNACGNNSKQKERKHREIKVRTIGSPDTAYAAELFAPLILKIYEREKAKHP